MPRPLIPLGGPMTPPKRFRLWGPGNNPGDYGDNLVSAAAVARVMGRYAERGVALAIDFQHASNPKENPGYDPAKPPPMAGYAELKEVPTPAGPEVWIDPVRWSDCGRPNAVPGEVCCGRHQIETGQRGYISPDWFVDPDTREPLFLERLSLVAEPGTYGINMLASRASAKPARTLPMTDIEILKALLAAAMACSSCSDADCQAMGVDVAKSVTDLATSKGLDLSSEAPASEAAPAVAAACDPEKKDVVASAAPQAPAQPDIEALVAAALTKRGVGVTASKGVTIADVRSIVAEDTEKRALLDANKDVLGGMVPLLASKPLAEVKQFVTAANVRASKGAENEAPRGPALGEDMGQPISIVDRYKSKNKK